MVITAVVVAIAMFVLRKTQFGRHTYAIGGNMEAAIRTGIPVDRHIIKLYMLSASTAGIAGFLSTLRFTAGSAVIGDALLLPSIAAVIIGGVSLFGGAGTVIGTVIGALIIAVLTTGLVMLNVEAFWQFIVVGAVVIIAVLIDQSRDLIIGRPRRGVSDDGRTDPLRPQPHQALRRPGRGQPGELGRLSRRGGGAPRRQRRRQVDADQVHLRRLPARGRRDLLPRRAHALHPADRCARRAASRRSTRTSRSPKNLDVPANIFLGRETKLRYFGGLVRMLDEKQMLTESKTRARFARRSISPTCRSRSRACRGGQRQAVAIARAVYWDARLMIMDEPTNNLGVPEQQKVLELIRRLRDQGVPVILITHTLPDVFAVADRLMVMHRGRKVTEKKTADTSTEELVQYMVGARDDTPGVTGCLTDMTAGKPAPPRAPSG